VAYEELPVAAERVSENYLRRARITAIDQLAHADVRVASEKHVWSGMMAGCRRNALLITVFVVYI